MSSHAHQFRSSIDDAEAFWVTRALDVDWDAPWHQVFDSEAAPALRWFVGGRLNTSFNCVARHVLAGNGERAAVHDVWPMLVGWAT
jgi:hypothetical protein